MKIVQAPNEGRHDAHKSRVKLSDKKVGRPRAAMASEKGRRRTWPINARQLLERAAPTKIPLQGDGKGTRRQLRRLRHEGRV